MYCFGYHRPQSELSGIIYRGGSKNYIDGSTWKDDVNNESDLEGGGGRKLVGENIETKPQINPQIYNGRRCKHP